MCARTKKPTKVVSSRSSAFRRRSIWRLSVPEAVCARRFCKMEARVCGTTRRPAPHGWLRRHPGAQPGLHPTPSEHASAAASSPHSTLDTVSAIQLSTDFDTSALESIGLQVTPLSLAMISLQKSRLSQKYSERRHSGLNIHVKRGELV